MSLNIRIQESEVQKLSPKITVIGVGGAGGNAVNNMISSNLEGCDFLVTNTDAQALGNSLSDQTLQLGVTVTGGLGAGSRPEVGRAAAEESLDDILQHLDGANMVFITAGMGGGTGTGAAPVIARACREKGILTVGVVTKPFHFEGSHRMKMAEEGIAAMQDYVDTLIVIPNQNLFRVANEKTTFAEAFKMADTVLQSGVRGVTDLMVRPGLVNLDFADIRTAMLEMGKAMMGTGEAEGEKRSIEAAEAAINNPLLDDVSMKGAHGVIINVTGGYDMTLFEADEACNRIRDEVDPNANIIFGATFDDSLEGKMRVSVVATGIEREEDEKSGEDTRGGQGTIPAKAGMSSRFSPVGTGSASGFGGATARESLPKAPAAATAAPKAAPVDEPDKDMFEQQEFTAPEKPEISQYAHNTAMKGTRYKDSFIPPAPVQVRAEPAQEPQQGTAFHQQTQQPFAPRAVSSNLSRPAAPSAPMSAPLSAPAVSKDMTEIPSAPSVPSQPTAPNPSIQTASGTSLSLNPPRPGANAHAQKKKSLSLFERITGHVVDQVQGFTGREDEARESAPRRSPAPTAPSLGSAPQQPMQGSLAIDAPAAQPRVNADDELDIPAFLRRQAN